MYNIGTIQSFIITCSMLTGMRKIFKIKHARHLHHISSHFTNGLFPAAAVCITLYLLTRSTLFDNASLYCCAMGAIAAPLVYGSGLIDWRYRFDKRRARIFNRKRAVGIALVLVSLLLIAFRLSLGSELTTVGAAKYIYIGGIYILAVMVTYLGYLGGKFIA